MSNGAYVKFQIEFRSLDWMYCSWNCVVTDWEYCTVLDGLYLSFWPCWCCLLQTGEKVIGAQGRDWIFHLKIDNSDSEDFKSVDSHNVKCMKNIFYLETAIRFFSAHHFEPSSPSSVIISTKNLSFVSRMKYCSISLEILSGLRCSSEWLHAATENSKICYEPSNHLSDDFI